jgi:hypothetical protein
MPAVANDALEIALLVARALDRAGVGYFVGGIRAAWTSG